MKPRTAIFGGVALLAIVGAAVAVRRSMAWVPAGPGVIVSCGDGRTFKTVIESRDHHVNPHPSDGSIVEVNTRTGELRGAAADRIRFSGCITDDERQIQLAAKLAREQAKAQASVLDRPWYEDVTNFMGALGSIIPG